MEAQLITVSDGSGPAFLISLDSFDLNLLPTLSSWRKDATVPLWTAPSSGVEYCEFEVLAGDGGGSDEQYENVPSQRCFVCQVHVPVTYWTEHITSARHKACWDIISTSLDRANKQLSVVAEPRVPREGSYFCPACCTTIPLTKRTTHEHSAQHAQSTLYQGLIESLTKLYQDQNNLTQVCKEILTIIADQEDVQYLESRSEIDIANNVDMKLKSNVKNLHTETNLKTHDTKSDVKNLGTQKDHQINNANISIITESGARLTVNFDNYHGLYTVANITQCRVCRILVDNKLEHVKDIEHKKKTVPRIRDRNCIRQLNHLLNHCILCNEIIENPEAHILCSEKHITLLHKALIKDDNIIDPTKETIATNCIQNVDFNKGLYYCKVCQIYFIKTDLINHISNQAHINYLESLSAGKKKILKQEYIETGYCHICEIHFSQGQNTEKLHHISKEHRYKVWLSKKENIIHYHMNKSNLINQVCCKICDVCIDDHRIDEHINGGNHQTKYQKLLQENYMKKSHDHYVFCSLCNRTELIIDELNHIKQTSHKKFMKNLITDVQGKPTSKGNSQNGLIEIKDIVLKHHLEKLSEKNYFCKLCSMHVTEESVLNHVTVKQHRKKLRKFQRNQQNITNNMNQGKSKKIIAPVANINKTNHKPQSVIAGTSQNNQIVEINPVYDNLLNLNVNNPKKSVHYLFKLMYDEPDVVQCVPCDVKMHYDEMTTHRKSKPHKDLYQDLLHSNTMFRIKHRCFCECCREILKVNCEYIHMNSPLHRHNLKQNTKRLDEVTLKDLSMKMFNESLKAEKHKKQNAIHLESSDNSDDDEICASLIPSVFQNNTMNRLGNCSEEGSVSNCTERLALTSANTEKDTMYSHKELKHLDVYPAFTRHLFDETQNSKEIICKICHSAVPYRTDLILEHVNGSKHSSKYDSLLKSNRLLVTDNVALGTRKYHCEACAEDFEPAVLFEHIHNDKTSACPQQIKVAKVNPQVKPIEDVKDNYKLLETKPNWISSEVGLQTSVVKDNTVWWICNVCNIKTNSSKHLEIHKSGDKHKNMLAQQTKVQTQSKSKVDIKMPVAQSATNPQIQRTYASIAKTTSSYEDVNNGFCNICKVNVPQHPQNIQEHLNGNIHKRNVKLISSKSIPQCVGNKNAPTASIPSVENITVKSKIVNKQVNSQDNFKTVAPLPETSAKKHDVENGICKVCKEQVSQDLKKIIEHLKGPNHNRIVRINTDKLNEVASTSNAKPASKSFCECKVCKITIEDTPQALYKHCKSEIHMKNMAKEKDAQDSTTRCNTNIILDKANNITSTATKVDAFPAVKPESNYECPICNVSVPNYYIKGHIEGARHKKNEEKQKTEQLIYDKDDINPSETVNPKIGFMCHICNVSVPNNPNNINGHIEGARHKNKLEKQQTERLINDKDKIDPSEIVNLGNIRKAIVPHNTNNIKGHIEGAKDNNTAKIQQSNVKVTSAHLLDVVQYNECIQNILIDHHLLKYINRMCDIKTQTTSVVDASVLDVTNADTITNGIDVSTIQNILIDHHLLKYVNRMYDIRTQTTSVVGASGSDVTKISNALTVTDRIDASATQNVLIDEHLLKYVYRMFDIKTHTISNTEITNTLVTTNRSAEYNEETHATEHDEGLLEIANIETNVSNEKEDSAIKEKNDADISSIQENANTNELTKTNPNSNYNNDNTTQTGSVLLETDDKDTGFYICSVCGRLVENNPTDIKSHLNSFHHKNKVEVKKLKEAEEVLPKTEAHFCDTCHIEVPNNAFDIKKHMDSMLHARNFEKLLHQNKIKIRGGIVCYCDVCDLYFSKYSMPTHIEKAKHKLLLSDNQ